MIKLKLGTMRVYQTNREKVRAKRKKKTTETKNLKLKQTNRLQDRKIYDRKN